MKLRIDQKSLSDGITVVSKAVPSKNTVSAIQECILVDASTEKIRLIGNDTELGIETVIDGTIEEHGTIAIDATMLGNIVRRLPGGDVNLWTENEDVFITCGAAMSARIAATASSCSSVSENGSAALNAASAGPSVTWQCGSMPESSSFRCMSM